MKQLTLTTAEVKVLNQRRKEQFLEACEAHGRSEVHRTMKKLKPELQKEVQRLFRAELKRALPRLVREATKKVYLYLDD